MAIRVLAVGNSNTTQVDHRSLIASLVAPGSSFAPRPGFFPSINSPGRVTNVSAMVAGIGPLRAIVPNSSGSGHFLVNSDSEINVTFDPGEGGVARTDRVIVRVYNDSQDGLGLNEARVEYLKGQTSGSATALPNNSLLIWEFPVPAGASSGNGGINFTSIAVDKRVYTAASGGLIPVLDTTEMNAITNPYDGMSVWHKAIDAILVHDGTSFKVKSPVAVASYSNLTSIPNPYEGLPVYVRDTDITYIHDGSTWRPRAPITVAAQANLTSIQNPYEGLIATVADTDLRYTYSSGAWVRETIHKLGTSNATTGSFVTVNFGYTFPAVPRVFAQANTGSGAQTSPTTMVTNVTTTSFQLRADIGTGTSGSVVPVFWVAIL